MLYQTNLQLLTSAAPSIDAGTANIFPVKIECRLNYFLRATAVSDLTVEARVQGTIDWTGIEISPLDLSPYNGNIKTVEIRLTAAGVMQITDRAFTLSVSK